MIMYEDIGDTQHLHNRELLRQNIDYGFNIFCSYIIHLPRFSIRRYGKDSFGSWYVVVSIAMFNIGDLVGRYITLIDSVKMENRPG